MKFFLAMLVYILMGAVLVMGVVMAAKGTFWLLGLAGLAYLILFIRFGCLEH